MSSIQQRNSLVGIFLFIGTWPLSTSIITIPEFHPIPPKRVIQVQSPGNATIIAKSLRKDIADHPSDFIVFETQVDANQFIMEHEEEVFRETELRVILRGIIGYWRGKTLVVLPSLSKAI